MAQKWNTTELQGIEKSRSPYQLLEFELEVVTKLVQDGMFRERVSAPLLCRKSD
jgi:hypothetical protein